MIFTKNWVHICRWKTACRESISEYGHQMQHRWMSLAHSMNGMRNPIPCRSWEKAVSGGCSFPAWKRERCISSWSMQGMAESSTKPILLPIMRNTGRALHLSLPILQALTGEIPSGWKPGTKRIWIKSLWRSTNAISVLLWSILTTVPPKDSTITGSLRTGS